MYTGTFTPKNSTTARKPGNDMRKNAGLPKMGNSPAANQRDTGLGFNGQSVTEQRSGTGQQYAHNHYTGKSNNDQGHNQRQMPNRKGNYADQSNNTKVPPCQTSGAMSGFKNPDSINVGNGPRNAGSTRNWAPSAGQNYKGNPNMIQERQMYNNRGNKD